MIRHHAWVCITKCASVLDVLSRIAKEDDMRIFCTTAVSPKTTQTRTSCLTTLTHVQFLDDGKVIKLYVPLPGIGAAVTDEDVTSSFQVRG